MLHILFTIYAIGLVGGLILLGCASRAEPTSHGQGVLWTTALLPVFFWPLAIAWVAIVGLGWCCVRVKDRLTSR